MSAKAPSVTLLAGPALAGLAEQLVRAGMARGLWAVRANTDADTYTRRLVSLFIHAGARQQSALVWLPDVGAAQTTHQRRSLERLVQGLRPALLIEAGWRGAPSWARVLEDGPARAWRPGAPVLSGSSKQPAAGLFEDAARALAPELEALRPANPGRGCGSWRPGGVLLVGDRPNSKTWPGEWDALSLPFISQLGTGCSAWLSEQLEQSGVPESQLYWVNAFRASGSVTCDLLELRAKLQPQLVVALGRNAGKLLQESGVTGFQEVHHPAHWKRFRWDEPYPLVKVLKRYAVQRGG